MERAGGLPVVRKNPLIDGVGSADGEAGDEKCPQGQGEGGDFEECLAGGPAGGALLGEGQDGTDGREGRAAGGTDSVGRVSEDAAAGAAAGIVVGVIAGTGAECAHEGHEQKNECKEAGDGEEDEMEGDGHCRM